MQSEGHGGQRTFSGSRLAEVAFPLGGIGTGTVSLGGRGNLQDWEIFNRPAKGRSLPYSFFALWARPEGGPAVARVLERKLLPPFVREHGLPPAQARGCPAWTRCASAASTPSRTWSSRTRPSPCG